MKHLFALIFILNLLNIHAQEIDSLLRVSKQLQSDTERVNVFYKEGFANRAVDPQYSFECAKQAEKFAQKSSDPYYIAKASNLLGILYYRKADLIKALSYHKKALNLRTIIGDKNGIAKSQINLGNIYTDLKKYPMAEDAYLQALAINNELGETKQIGNCLLNLGVMKSGEGSPKKDSIVLSIAKNYFNQALRNAKARSDYELEAQCYNNLAVINMQTHQFDEAIANSQNSIKIKNLMDNEMEMADSYGNMAWSYLYKQDLKSAKENLIIADSIVKKYEYVEAGIQIARIWADYYVADKNYEMAYKYLNEYQQMKEAFQKQAEEINLQNNFIEQFGQEEVIKENKNRFPYLFFNALIIMGILIGLFIFKYKR